jgi:hypothetical protein
LPGFDFLSKFTVNDHKASRNEYISAYIQRICIKFFPVLEWTQCSSRRIVVPTTSILSRADDRRGDHVCMWIERKISNDCVAYGIEILGAGIVEVELQLVLRVVSKYMRQKGS